MGNYPKSIFTKFYIILSILTLSFMLTSCGGGNEETEQSYNENTSSIVTSSEVEKMIDEGKNSISNKNDEENTNTGLAEVIPKDELIFNLNAKFTGYGEISIDLESNLLNKELSMNVFSISDLFPGEKEMYGIKYSKLYSTILPVNERNYDLNNSSNEFLQTTDINGNFKSSFVLFHDKAKEKDYTSYEIDNLKSSNLFKDKELASYIKAKNIFNKDKKVIIDYRLSESELLELGFLKDVKLPSICSKVNYKNSGGNTIEEISCKKEITFDGDEIKNEKRVIKIIYNNSTPYINRSGANQDCKFSKNGRLATKDEIKNNISEIQKLFEGTTIKFLRSYEENLGNVNSTNEWSGWIEPIFGTEKGKWLEVFKPMQKNNIDYVGYICLEK